MANRTCSIDGCTSRVRARGWCGKHYQRWTRSGDPESAAIPRFASWAESFAANAPTVDGPNGCRLWRGGVAGNGYGMVWAKHEHISAHRYAWEREHGPVPEGMFVDHICHQRHCIALPHLRLATAGENTRNRAGAASHNATGVRGVRKMRKKYSGRVRKDGVEYNAGTYATIDEAAEAVRKLREELFGEFAGRG